MTYLGDPKQDFKRLIGLYEEVSFVTMPAYITRHYERTSRTPLVAEALALELMYLRGLSKTMTVWAYDPDIQQWKIWTSSTPINAKKRERSILYEKVELKHDPQSSNRMSIEDIPLSW